MSRTPRNTTPLNVFDMVDRERWFRCFLKAWAAEMKHPALYPARPPILPICLVKLSFLSHEKVRGSQLSFKVPSCPFFCRRQTKSLFFVFLIHLTNRGVQFFSIWAVSIFSIIVIYCQLLSDFQSVVQFSDRLSHVDEVSVTPTVTQMPTSPLFHGLARAVKALVRRGEEVEDYLHWLADALKRSDAQWTTM